MWNDIDRSQPYSTQHAVTMKVMHQFVCGDNPNIEMPIRKDEFIKQGLIEFAPSMEMSKFTRNQVNTGLAKAAKNAISTGLGTCQALPTKAGNPASKTICVTMHTIASGKRQGQKVNACLQGLAKFRRQVKIDAAQALEAAYRANKDLPIYVAEGVVDKDGAARTFIDFNKAAKAWLQANYNKKDATGKVVEQWWETDPVTKSLRKAESMSKVSTL